MKLALEPAIHLLHEAGYGTLATHSTQLPGYPYASALPYVTDECQRPLILVSMLAEHTRNLLADPRVSLSIVAPGAGPDVLQLPRATLLGDAERIEPGKLLLARYLRYQPEAEEYLGLDFSFFRIHPRRIRHIAGIGRMGWLGDEEWACAKRLPLADELEWIGLSESLARPGIAILGIDSYGIDYRSNGRLRREAVGGEGGSGEIDETWLRERVPDLGVETPGSGAR